MIVNRTGRRLTHWSRSLSLMGELIPWHGGYRKLRGFQAAQAVYDATVVFCHRFIDKRSRTHDQMVQAARSGVQNIAEGGIWAGRYSKPARVGFVTRTGRPEQAGDRGQQVGEGLLNTYGRGSG